MANPSPLRYPGGKHKTYQYIKELIAVNKCTSYIEPFAGGSAVALELLINKQVKKIVINDYDRAIYAFWYSVLYHTNELIELIRNTPVTMENWNLQKKIQSNKDTESLLHLGFSTFFLNRTNRSGIIKAGVIGGHAQAGNYKLDCRYPKKSLINKIQIIGELRDSIEVYNMDAIDFIKNIIKKTRNSFTFFDPPYYLKGPGLYTNFYTHNDHECLANTIKQDLRNRKWIVTYDFCPEIKNMYNKLAYQTFFLNYSAENKRKGLEYMFFSKCTIIPESQEQKLHICDVNF